MPWNKFVQYLIAFGISFLVFGSVLLSENAHFAFLSGIKNPFASAKDLQEVVSLPKDGKVKELLLSNGELWTLFPGVEVEFQKEKREMRNGTVFVSGIFLGKDSPSHLIQIGSVSIDIRGRNVWLMRDREAGRSEISAIVSSVPVYFAPLPSTPFVIPHGMKITVRDHETAPFPPSYTEQKKFLSLEKVVPSDPLSFVLGQEEKWKARVRNFALTAPSTQIRLPEDNSFSRFIGSVKNIQNSVAIGMPDRLKEKRKFQSFLAPLIISHLLAQEGNTELAKQSLATFALHISGSEWQGIFSRNAELQTRWNDFFRVYEAWTHTLLPEPKDAIFFSFWREQNATSPIEKLELIFSNIEKFDSKGSYADTQIELKKMNVVMMEAGKTFLKSDLPRITLLRRLWASMLLYEPFFQQEVWFEMYDTFVTKELELSEGPLKSDSLREEISHDIFAFLENFLEDREKIDVSKIILRSYQRLGIENLVARLGRSVFSPEENELIKLVALLGNTGLTKDELDAIQIARANQDSLNERIEEIKSQKEGDDDQMKREISQVANALYLKNLLEESGVSTEKMDFRTSREVGTTQFGNGHYKLLPVSGVFYYPTQLFQTLQVGKESTEKLHERFLKGFLQQAESANVKKETTLPKTETKIYISQTTPKAILERKLVQEILESEGIKISRDFIQVADTEMQFFRIFGVNVYGASNAEFTYNRSSGEVKGFSARIGTREVSFGAEEISFTELRDLVKTEEAKEMKKKVEK